MRPAEELVETTTKRVRIRKFPVRRRTTVDDDNRSETPELDPSPTGVDDALGFRSSCSTPIARLSVELYADDDVPVVKMTTRISMPTQKRFKKKQAAAPQQQPQRQPQLLQLVQQRQMQQKTRQPSVKLIDDLRVSYLKKAPQLQNETLRDFLANAPQQRHLTWHKLLDTALSLEELHAQGSVHGRLQGRNILISTDGSQRARVRNFGAAYNRCGSIGERSSSTRRNSYLDVDDHAARWIAPECLDGAAHSQESDVFSLGMCILEAVTLTDPWGAVSDDVARVLQTAGRLPSRPSVFAQDAQWELVERMCAREPTQRPTLAGVVRHLRRFAEQEQRARVQMQRDAPAVLYCA